MIVAFSKNKTNHANSNFFKPLDLPRDGPKAVVVVIMALSAATRRLRRNIIFFNSGYNNELDGLPKLMMKMLTKNVDCEEALIQLRTRIPGKLFVGMLRYPL